VYAYPVANPQVRPACVLFLPGEPSYYVPRMSMARNSPAEINLVVRLFVNSADNESAMQQLDDWLTGDAAHNLTDAIDGDYVFSGDIGGSAHVSEVTNFAAGTVELGGSPVEVMSCDLLVKVYVQRS
jgi:hypothetical protein